MIGLMLGNSISLRLEHPLPYGALSSQLTVTILPESCVAGSVELWVRSRVATYTGLFVLKGAVTESQVGLLSRVDVLSWRSASLSTAEFCPLGVTVPPSCRSKCCSPCRWLLTPSTGVHLPSIVLRSDNCLLHDERFPCTVARCRHLPQCSRHRANRCTVVTVCKCIIVPSQCPVADARTCQQFTFVVNSLVHVISPVQSVAR